MEEWKCWLKRFSPVYRFFTYTKRGREGKLKRFDMLFAKKKMENRGCSNVSWICRSNTLCFLITFTLLMKLSHNRPYVSWVFYDLLLSYLKTELKYSKMDEWRTLTLPYCFVFVVNSLDYFCYELLKKAHEFVHIFWTPKHK